MPSTTSPRYSRWRIAAWCFPAVVLLCFFVASRLTEEVRWGAEDYVVAAAILFSVVAVFELALRVNTNLTYRIAMLVALATGLALTWVNLAVGIIGTEGNPANRIYFGVILVGIIGAFIARLKPRGMAYTLFATALGLLIAAAIALSLTGGPYISVRGVLVTHGIFVLMFVTSAILFRKSADQVAKVSRPD